MRKLSSSRHFSPWQRGLAAVSVGALLALGGCVVEPLHAHYVGEVVATAPPAPQDEVVGVAPVAGYVWIGGYWNWVGGRHLWVAGHWEAPRPGWAWEPHAWVRVGGGWRLREGHWVRR